MQPDLLERARSASSLEEEVLVVFEAVQHSALPVEQRRELCRIVMMAGKDVPRPALLGVVAALVPEGSRYTIGARGVSLRTPSNWTVQQGPACSLATLLLIAILEAGNG